MSHNKVIIAFVSQLKKKNTKKTGDCPRDRAGFWPPTRPGRILTVARPSRVLATHAIRHGFGHHASIPNERTASTMIQSTNIVR